jgi:hypothetical protein
MQRITIGRYKAADDSVHVGSIGGVSIPVSMAFDGWIEGTRDDGSTWIMWLDAVGNPLIFFGQRDAESGAVEGEPVLLSPGHPYFED